MYSLSTRPRAFCCFIFPQLSASAAGVGLAVNQGHTFRVPPVRFQESPGDCLALVKSLRCLFLTSPTQCCCYVPLRASPTEAVNQGHTIPGSSLQTSGFSQPPDCSLRLQTPGSSLHAPDFRLQTQTLRTPASLQIPDSKRQTPWAGLPPPPLVSRLFADI